MIPTSYERVAQIFHWELPKEVPEGDKYKYYRDALQAKG